MNEKIPSVNDRPTISENEFQSRLDRLVSGDLDDSTRAELILSMESNPQQWRACALAFLEAQLWSESMILAGDAHLHVPMRPSENSELVRLEKTQSAARGRIPFPISLVTAASILLAFTMGWAVERGVLFLASGTIVRAPNSEKGSIAKTNESMARTNIETNEQVLNQLRSNEPLGNKHLVWATRVLPSEGDLPGARIQIPLDPARTNPEERELKLSIYDRQMMARRGLEFSTQRQFITAKLSDGKDVAVPVDRVVARLVGSEVN